MIASSHAKRKPLKKEVVTLKDEVQSIKVCPLKATRRDYIKGNVKIGKDK